MVMIHVPNAWVFLQSVSTKKTILNSSRKFINTALPRMKDDSEIREFGLARKGNADAVGQRANQLVVNNENDSEVNVSIGVEETRSTP